MRKLVNHFAFGLICLGLFGAMVSMEFVYLFAPGVTLAVFGLFIFIVSK